MREGAGTSRPPPRARPGVLVERIHVFTAHTIISFSPRLRTQERLALGVTPHSANV